MELDFVRWLTEQISTGDAVAVGIGDDAAVLEVPANRQLVVTTDMLIDGAHFELERHTPEQIGRKALAVNLSDLAAMAAEPLAAVVSLSLPKAEANSTLARDLTSGMTVLARQTQCPVVGGDTNVATGPLVVSVTAFGTAELGKAWLRSGAQAGDRLLVSGTLGGSMQGHHLSFTPRVAEALELAAQYEVHAAMDLSDGLALDLSRMIQASNVGAVVDIAKLPISQAANEMAQQSGKSPTAHALSDGEDFELLLAVPPATVTRLLAEQPLECGLTDVGEIVAGKNLMQRDAAGAISPLKAEGYEHR